MGDSGNPWLAVLAVATAVQAAVIVGVLVVMLRTMKQLHAQVTRLEREHLQPMATRFSAIADDVQDGIKRLRSADDQLRHAVLRSVEGTVRAAEFAKRQAWPAVAVVRGAAAILKFFTTDRRRPAAVDLYPKGVHHARQ